MSSFSVEVVRISIISHPNADAIEIAQVGDYQSIVRKGQFNDGDLACYIPEQAIVPEWLLKEMGLWDEVKQKGMLAGSLGNRVKAIKLRGVVSQGLMLAVAPYSETEVLVISEPHDGNQGSGIVAIGGDASECLGITKYEPSVPSHMRGRIVGVDFDATHNYDFDNLKKKTKLFTDGEDVVITEKIHGTLIQVGIVPSHSANERFHKGRVTISSKGMGAKGYVLDHDDETNLYAQAAKKHNLLDGMIRVFGEYADNTGKPIFVLGEVFGRTLGGGEVQDLTYSDNPLDFRAFDICVGNRGTEEYLSWPDFVISCDMLGVQHVPMLYRGPYSKEVVLEHTNGLTTFVAPRGKKTHMREGVVVKSATEARNIHYGRKIAKSVSDAYLLRKGGSEFQ